MMRVAEAFLAEFGAQAARSATMWLERAAIAGAAGAASELGRAYWAGHGVSADPTRATGWWRYGATRGDTRSMACLGTAYLVGEGDRASDPVRAAEWSLRRETANRGYSLLGPTVGDFERVLPAVQMLEARRLAAEPLMQAGVPNAEAASLIVAPPIVQPPAVVQPVAMLTNANYGVGIWPSALGFAMAPSRPVASPPSGTSEYRGTGVVIAAPGVVLTAAHVVSGCTGLEIHQGLARFGEPEIRGANEPLDLALLVVPGLDRPALPVGGNVRLGTEVVTLGFPGQGLQALRPAVTLGNISILGERTAAGFLQFTAPIQAGNSGGPLLDRQGRIVGIAIATRNALGDLVVGLNIPQNVNLAVSAAVVERFLNDYGVRVAQSPAQEGSFADLIETTERSVVRVICHRPREQENKDRPGVTARARAAR